MGCSVHSGGMESQAREPETEVLEAQPEGGISAECIDAVREALETQDSVRVCQLVEDFHASDYAELFGLISSVERRQLVEAIYEHFEPEILTYLDEAVRVEVMNYLGTEKLAEAIAELETDDAVQVIEDMKAADQQELLEAIPEEYRADLEAGLAYPEESAGRLMQKRFVAVPEFWQVGDVIDFLRKSDDLPEDFYEIIVVDPRYKPVGSVMISRVMQNHRNRSIRELMKDDIQPISTTTDQEEVAHLFRRYGLVEAPVVSEQGRLVGVITIDDVVHVIAEEEEEDYLRSGGVIDRDLHAGLFSTFRRRFPWLAVNLLTASLGALVIGQFEATIAEMVTLAVLMPIIASMAGNAGIQSVTVAVRSIATRELQRHNAWPVIRKEMLTNLLNGLGLGLLMIGAIMAIYGNLQLAGIFAAALVGTLTIAGLAGATIPLILSYFKVDPAIASGVFLTTLTDILSFFTFLGLAALFLL